MHISEQSYIVINGKPQYVSLRAEKEGAPLLLYLHGGPGDAALPLVLKHNAELERHFTVAVWEQRGAGKSYYKFADTETVSIQTFLDDLHRLSDILLERLGQEQLYLVGHSWGSVLGLRYTAEHPERVRTYIGCGQVVNMKKSCRTAYEFALAHADKKTAEKLRGIDCTYTGTDWLRDLLFVTGQVVRHGGSLYGKTNYADLALPFLFSHYYRIPDLIKRQKGGMQSIRRLWQELMETDFEGQTACGAPVIFAEGRHDVHVSSELAKIYYDTITSEKQFFWFEKSCHFPQWNQSADFNRLVIDLVR